ASPRSVWMSRLARCWQIRSYGPNPATGKERSMCMARGRDTTFPVAGTWNWSDTARRFTHRGGAMDLKKVIQRARSLLVSPRTGWPGMAADPATVTDLYRQYIMVVAAIPAICQFIKTSILGYAWHGFKVYRVGVAQGLAAALVEYGASLLVVYL